MHTPVSFPLALLVVRISVDGVIKVADFGLSKAIVDKPYFRQDKMAMVKLPFKWMALESIEDGVFSEKTDVVSSNKIIAAL